MNTSTDEAETHILDELNWGTLHDWGQLVRLPTSFTLFSNCLAAAIVVDCNWLPWTAMIPTVLASLCAYWAGMILNDVVDIEEDREHRPKRPLPAGKISPIIAGHVATGMLIIGPILILAVSTFHHVDQTWLGIAFAASVSLSLCVRIYNSSIKSTPLGPVFMGACRGMNILTVGTTMIAASTANTDVAVEIPRALLVLAAGVSVYIMGVTVYASREETQSFAPVLVLGVILEIVGLIAIGSLPHWTTQTPWLTLDPMRGYPLLICLVGLTVVNRGFAGVRHPVSRKVQLAVKHAILTMILLDAAIVLMWAGPWYAGLVILLLLPAMFSAMRFRAT